VHDIDGKPVAFMSYYQSDLSGFFGLRFAMWKMALIAPQCRGAGLGARFFKSLLHYHRTEGLDIVDSGLSMRNTASVNLHNKSGFKRICTLETLDRWLR
jgi:L-amino acid N-acyltransferase YncA